MRWIHQVSAAYGLSPTYWAKTAGVAPSTLNKFLTGEQADKNLSAKTIEKLSSVLSALQPGRLMNASESREASFWADIPIIGDINDGNLVAACDVQITHSHTMQILFHSGYEKVPLFAFQVSKITSFPEVVQGEILICTPVCRLTGRQPLNGDRYILHDLIGHLVQASIREFTIDPTGKNWLVPLGYEAKHRSATYVNPEGPVSSLLDAGVMPPPREGEPGVKATFLIVGSVKPVIRLSGDRLRLTTAL